MSLLKVWFRGVLDKKLYEGWRQVLHIQEDNTFCQNFLENEDKVREKLLLPKLSSQRERKNDDVQVIKTILGIGCNNLMWRIKAKQNHDKPDRIGKERDEETKHFKMNTDMRR